MSLNELVIWVVIGGIAGYLADLIVKGISFGLVGTIIIGMVGGIIGGWLFAQLGIAAGIGIIGSVITAFVGAVILLLIIRAIRRA